MENGRKTLQSKIIPIQEAEFCINHISSFKGLSDTIRMMLLFCIFIYLFCKIRFVKLYAVIFVCLVNLRNDVILQADLSIYAFLPFVFCKCTYSSVCLIFVVFLISCVFVGNIHNVTFVQHFPISFYLLNHNKSNFFLTLQSSKGTMRKPSG